MAKEALTLIGVGDSGDVTSSKRALSKGDILFGKLRPYFRKVMLAKFSGICSTDIWVIRARPGTHQRSLYYHYHRFIDFATRSSTGAKMPRVTWEFLQDMLWDISHQMGQPLQSARTSERQISHCQTISDKTGSAHRYRGQRQPGLRQHPMHQPERALTLTMAEAVSGQSPANSPDADTPGGTWSLLTVRKPYRAKNPSAFSVRM